jgi:hypothetical protein
MKQADVKVGGIYMVRVGSNIHLSRVRITQIIEAQSFGGGIGRKSYHRRERWEGTNLSTGRTISGTAARLRGPAPTYHILAEDLSCLVGPFDSISAAVLHKDFRVIRGDSAKMKIIKSQDADILRPKVGDCRTPLEDVKTRQV